MATFGLNDDDDEAALEYKLPFDEHTTMNIRPIVGRWRPLFFYLVFLFSSSSAAAHSRSIPFPILALRGCRRRLVICRTMEEEEIALLV